MCQGTSGAGSSQHCPGQNAYPAQEEHNIMTLVSKSLLVNKLCFNFYMQQGVNNNAVLLDFGLKKVVHVIRFFNIFLKKPVRQNVKKETLR